MTGSISLYEIGCRGLLAANVGPFHRGTPTSDPYIVFSIGDNRVQTKTLYKTLNPKWENEVLVLSVPPQGGQMLIQVFDWARTHKDELLGEIRMALPGEYATGQVDQYLTSGTGQKKDAKGEMFCKYILAYTAEEGQHASMQGHKSSAGPGTQIEKKMASVQADGKFVIERLAATGLRAADKKVFGKDSSDPYCIIKVRSPSKENEPVLTHVIKNTLNPDWTTTFHPNPTLELIIEEPGSSIKFIIMDKDRVGADDHLGEYTIELPTTSKGNQSFSEPLIQGADCKKPPQGTLSCKYMYKAPLGALHEMKSRASAASSNDICFGKLRFRNLSCEGLRAADFKIPGLRGSGSSDPYLQITLMQNSGNVSQRTKTIRNHKNPKWDEILRFDIIERWFEIQIEVLDEDRLGSDDSLGVYRMEVPDVDTDWTRVTDALEDNPLQSHKAEGILKFEYEVQYDEELEWISSFSSEVYEKVAKRMAAVSRAGSGKFRPVQTAGFTFCIMEHSNTVVEFFNDDMDLLMWRKNPAKSTAFFVICVYICWKSLFFQAVNAGMVLLLLWQYACKFVYEPAPKVPQVTAENKPDPANQEGILSTLGFCSEVMWTTATSLNYFVSLFTWDDPVTTKWIMIAAAGAFVVSIFVSVHMLVLMGVIYLFTIQSFYWNYPLFCERFPFPRLLTLATDWITTQMGFDSIVPGFNAEVQMKIIKAEELMMSEAVTVLSGVFKTLQPDPFMICGITGRKMKTRHIKNSVNPEWNTDLGSFYVNRRGQKFSFEVYDYDGKLGKSDFLGYAEFRVDTSVPKGTKAWLPLSRRVGTQDNKHLITGRIKIEYGVTITRHGNK